MKKNKQKHDRESSSHVNEPKHQSETHEITAEPVPSVEAKPSEAKPTTAPKTLAEVKTLLGMVSDIVVEHIEGMAEGEKTTLKELKEIVKNKTGVDSTNLIPTISLVVKSMTGIHSEQGRLGGIYKGRRIKVEKAPDTRTRCTSCHQVIREKGKPRKKRAKKGENAETTVDASNASDEATSENVAAE